MLTWNREERHATDKSANLNDSISTLSGHPSPAEERSIAMVPGAREKGDAHRRFTWAQERRQFEHDIRECTQRHFSTFYHQLSDASLQAVSELKTVLSAELKQVSLKENINVIRQLDRIKAEVDRQFAYVCNLIREAQPADLSPVIKAVQEIRGAQLPCERNGLVDVEQALFRRIQEIDSSVNLLVDTLRSHGNALCQGFSDTRDTIRQTHLDDISVAVEAVVRNLMAGITQDFTKVHDSIRLCAQGPNLAPLEDTIAKYSERMNNDMQDAIDKHNEQFMDRFVRLHESLLQKQSDMSEAMRVHKGETRQYYDQVHFATVIDAIRKHIEQVIQKLAEISKQQSKSHADLRPVCDKMYAAIQTHSAHMRDELVRLHDIVAEKQKDSNSESAISQVQPIRDDMYRLNDQLGQMREKFVEMNDEVTKRIQLIEQQRDQAIQQRDHANRDVEHLRAENDELRNARRLSQKVDVDCRDASVGSGGQDLQSVLSAIKDLRDNREKTDADTLQAIQKTLKEHQPDTTIMEGIRKTLDEVKKTVDAIQEVNDNDDLRSLPDISSSSGGNTKARKSIAFQELKFDMLSQIGKVREEMSSQMRGCFDPEMLRKSMAVVMKDQMPQLRSCSQCYCETVNGSWADGDWYCKRCHDEWVYEHGGTQTEEESKGNRNVSFASSEGESGSDIESLENSSKGSDVEVVDLLALQG